MTTKSGKKRVNTTWTTQKTNVITLTLTLKLAPLKETYECNLMFYERPMASNSFIPGESAMGKVQRNQTVANDVI